MSITDCCLALELLTTVNFWRSNGLKNCKALAWQNQLSSSISENTDREVRPALEAANGMAITDYLKVFQLMSAGHTVSRNTAGTPLNSFSSSISSYVLNFYSLGPCDLQRTAILRLLELFSGTFDTTPCLLQITCRQAAEMDQGCGTQIAVAMTVLIGNILCRKW